MLHHLQSGALYLPAALAMFMDADDEAAKKVRPLSGSLETSG
jgi:hypothetical protein